jgi:aspartate kinase
MIAVKFGGSSIANADRIKCVAGLVNDMISQKPVVVLSAISNTTDLIIKAGNAALDGKIDIEELKQLHYNMIYELGLQTNIIDPFFLELSNLLMGISLIGELSDRTYDHLISFGERISIRIFASHLNNNGLKAKAYDPWDLGIVTDSNFTKAELLDSSYISIRSSLGYLESNYDHVPVIAGFIGKDIDGKITTFGRGGSDLTVSVLGAALDTKEIQVWKDVNGILSCDPCLVDDPITNKEISFEEASELAYFGAKVLHPRSLLPAMKRNIPVVVKNYLDPDYIGTKIYNNVSNEATELLRAITIKRNITLVDLVSTRMLGNYGFLSKVFGILKELKISVDMVATSEVSISFTLDYDENYELLVRELEKIATVNVNKQNAIISLIGSVNRSSEILLMAFEVINNLGVNVQMISQGASKVNISFIINDNEAVRCVKELHKKFFYGE